MQSTGGEIYALGGRGPLGFGIWLQNNLTYSGNATLNAYGSYNNAGIQCIPNYVIRPVLEGTVTLNAIGGEGAKGMVVTYDSSSITAPVFVDNDPVLNITNNSDSAELHRLTAQVGGAWDLTDATLAAGVDGDTTVIISIALGATGTIRR